MELTNALREVRSGAETSEELLRASHAAETRQLVQDALRLEQHAVENTVTSTQNAAQIYVRTKIENLETESSVRQREVESLTDKFRMYRDEVQGSETEAQRRHSDAVARAAASVQQNSLSTAMPCQMCPLVRPRLTRWLRNSSTRWTRSLDYVSPLRAPSRT